MGFKASKDFAQRAHACRARATLSASDTPRMRPGARQLQPRRGRRPAAIRRHERQRAVRALHGQLHDRAA